MRNSRKKVIGLVGAVFGAAAIMGGSLGLAAGAPQDLPAGAAYIGGPFESMSPQKFTSCLPQNSWNSIYVWDAPNQQWRHYINPAKVPAYVNNEEVGGITAIPRLSGLAILLDTAVQGAVFPVTNGTACP